MGISANQQHKSHGVWLNVLLETLVFLYFDNYVMYAIC